MLSDARSCHTMSSLLVLVLALLVLLLSLLLLRARPAVFGAAPRAALRLW